MFVAETSMVREPGLLCDCGDVENPPTRRSQEAYFLPIPDDIDAEQKAKKRRRQDTPVVEDNNDISNAAIVPAPAEEKDEKYDFEFKYQEACCAIS